MIKHRLRIPLLTFWTGLAIGCVVIAATFITAPEAHMVRYFSSDTLYLPSIYRDLFVDDGSLLEWSLNPAPNFFPDMGLFFLLNALLGNFLLAAYVYPMVQFVIMAVLFRMILRETGDDDRDPGAGIGAILLSLLAMSAMVGGDFDLAANLLLNSYHLGAFVNSLLATLCLLRLLKGSSRWWALPLTLVVMAAAVSDKLFWVTFLVPATGCLLFLSVRKHARARHLLLPALMNSAAWAAGRSLHRLAESTELNIEEPYAFLSFDRIASSWDHFVIAMGSWLTGPWLSRALVAAILVVMVAVVWSGVLAAWRWLFAHSTTSDPAALVRTASRVMAMLFFPIVLFAPVLNGSFDGVDSIRYDYSVFVLALLTAGPLLANALGRRSMLLWACLSVATLSTSLMLMATGARTYEDVVHYRPERVKAMDLLAERHGLKNGIAGYWDAKTMTMFSSQGLKVLPVFADLSIYIHVNRERMFYENVTGDGKPVMFSFAVIRDDDEGRSMDQALRGDRSTYEEGPVRIVVTAPFAYARETRKPAPSPL